MDIKCPFCGGRAIVTMKYTERDDVNVIRTYCPTCKSSVEVRGTNPMDRLRALDDRLMPDGMKWPRWKDGEKVMVGDTFTVRGDNTVCVVKEVSFEGDGASIRDDKCVPWDIDECARCVPDTNDHIYADALKNACDYWNGCDVSTASCNTCKHGKIATGLSCNVNMKLDLLRRQRELDKKEGN